MKRKIAVLLLTLAYSILLLHAAIPHHNHEGLFCIIETEKSYVHDHQCEDHDHSKHSHTTSNKHKHHHENGELECELNTKVVIPNNSQLSLKAIEIDLLENNILNMDFFIQSINESNPLVFYLNQSDQLYFQPPLYQVFIEDIKGLRAPPSFV